MTSPEIAALEDRLTLLEAAMQAQVKLNENLSGRVIALEAKWPPGWTVERIRKVIDHYENQTEAEALAEDEGR